MSLSLLSTSLGEKMKALTTLSVLALASGSAMALDTTMNLKGRFDYINQKTETKSSANVTTKTSPSEMKPGYLVWTTDAKFNDKATVRLALDLVDANSATGNVVSEFIDEAVWTQSVMPGLSLMIGKQAPMMGGHEQSASKRDVYGASRYNAGLPDNSTGLGVGYTFMNQNLYAQYLENNTNSTNPTLTDKKIANVAFVGNVMDGMITPMLSYTKVGTGRLGQYDIHTAAGLAASYMNVVFQFDYLMRENQKAGTNQAGTATDAELTTMVAHVRYNHENYKPFFKYIKEDAEGSYDLGASFSGAVESERTVMELGLEYVPNKDEDMRYHLVYSAAETEETKRLTANAAENNEKFEDTKIYAGVAFGMNLLK